VNLKVFEERNDGIFNRESAEGVAIIQLQRVGNTMCVSEEEKKKEMREICTNGQ